MPEPSTPQITHLGAGFFTVHVNLEELLGGESPVGEARRLVRIIDQSQEIRGAQFACGLILFKGDDVFLASAIATSAFATENGIYRTYGQDNWDLILFCEDRTLEQRQATMRVFMAEIPKIQASSDALTARLEAA